MNHITHRNSSRLEHFAQVQKTLIVTVQLCEKYALSAEPLAAANASTWIVVRVVQYLHVVLAAHQDSLHGRHRPVTEDVIKGSAV